EQRQRGVLVSGGHDGAGQRHAAFDDELLHRAAARLPRPMSLPMTRDKAWTLFCEWTESESLRRHVLAVEACMRAYAEKFGEDPERWGMVGMLHDLDYERYPDLHTGHPRYALAELERLGFPQAMLRGGAPHADALRAPPD